MKKPRKKQSLDMDELCRACCVLTKEITSNILEQAKADKAGSFQEIELVGHMKKCLGIDHYAETHLQNLLRSKLHGKARYWHFFGEEGLRNPSENFANKNNICVLADAVDGTDLIEKGLSNWCSTFAVIDPRRKAGKRLLASFVGTPDKEVFFARLDQDGAFVIKAKNDHESKQSEPEPVSGPSKVKKLSNASVCFYGQKAKNLLGTMKTGFLSSLNTQTSHPFGNRKESITRIYNLGGIPMMIKLAHNSSGGRRRIDAVFDVVGQMPHDVVSGAYIAKKAGATLLHLDGREFTYEELEESLMRPSQSRLKYILAATPKLAKELSSCLYAPENAENKEVN